MAGSRQKALTLLKHPTAKIDEDYGLVLCKMHNFREGTLHLLHKLQFYKEIISYHIEHKEDDELIKAANKYASKDAMVWLEVLSYFAGKEEPSPKTSASPSSPSPSSAPSAAPSSVNMGYIKSILSNIESQGVLPPLLVLQVLAGKPGATLSLVKDYISRRLTQENQLISEDIRQVRQYKEETSKMRGEIYDLRTSAARFQHTKCHACQSPLELPTVHFLCMHSFHLRCLGENEAECPHCYPQNKKILDIKKSLQESIGHEKFFKQLEGSHDGFATVAEYFGRGVFSHSNPPPIGSPGVSLPIDSKSSRALLFD